MSENKEIPKAALQWMIEEGITLQFTVIPLTKEIAIKGEKKEIVDFKLGSKKPSKFKFASNIKVGSEYQSHTSDYVESDMDTFQETLMTLFKEQSSIAMEKFFKAKI